MAQQPDRPQLLASISIGTQSEEGVVFRRLPTRRPIQECRLAHELWVIAGPGRAGKFIRQLGPALSTGAILTLFQGTAV